MDYEAMSKLLTAAIEENAEDFEPDIALSRRVRRAMEYMDFYAQNVTVFGSRKKSILAAGVDLNRMHLGADELRTTFENLAGVHYHAPSFEINDEYVKMCIRDRYWILRICQYILPNTKRPQANFRMKFWHKQPLCILIPGYRTDIFRHRQSGRNTLSKQTRQRKCGRAAPPPSAPLRGACYLQTERRRHDPCIFYPGIFRNQQSGGFACWI